LGRSGRHGAVATAVDSSDATLDAPLFTGWLASKLPAQKLDAYYASRFSSGRSRLRELYAKSSFYSWRLLRVATMVYVVVAGAMLVVGVGVMYWIAVDGGSFKLLDVVCSFVFGTVLAKSVDTALSCWESSRELEGVARDLLNLSQAGAIEHLVLRYDIDRASGVSIPTPLYKLMRTGLESEWEKRSAELEELVAE
ncbi:MAG: hypothetical protein AAF658_12205, partial [Myxococcota bacterium]